MDEKLLLNLSTVLFHTRSGQNPVEGIVLELSVLIFCDF